MKTFEEFLIEVIIEGTPEPKYDPRLLMDSYKSVRKIFPVFEMIHRSSVEAAQRYSDQNKENWISVDDSLPEMINGRVSDLVMVCCIDFFNPNYQFLWYCYLNADSMWLDNEGQKFTVSHWMPNPDLPTL